MYQSLSQNVTFPYIKMRLSLININFLHTYLIMMEDDGLQTFKYITRVVVHGVSLVALVWNSPRLKTPERGLAKTNYKTSIPATHLLYLLRRKSFQSFLSLVSFTRIYLHSQVHVTWRNVKPVAAAPLAVIVAQIKQFYSWAVGKNKPPKVP